MGGRVSDRKGCYLGGGRKENGRGRGGSTNLVQVVISTAIRTIKPAKTAIRILVDAAERLNRDLMATVEAGQFPAEERRHGQSIRGGGRCLLMSRDDVVCVVCLCVLIILFLFYFFIFAVFREEKSKKKTVRLRTFGKLTRAIRRCVITVVIMCYYRCYCVLILLLLSLPLLLLLHSVFQLLLRPVIPLLFPSPSPLKSDRATFLASVHSPRSQRDVCLPVRIAISPSNRNRPDRVMANHSGEHIDDIVSVLANHASQAGRSIYIDRSHCRDVRTFNQPTNQS